MKLMDKIMIKILGLLAILAMLGGASVFLIAKTYLIDYTEIGLIEKDLISISIILEISAVLFFAVSLALKKKIKNDLPVIKMCEEGFIDNGPMEIGLIPWSNIEKFTVYEIMDGYNSRKYLGIWIKDLGQLCESLPESKAELVKANASTDAPPVVIPQTLIREDLNKVIEKIILYKKELSYRDRSI